MRLPRKNPQNASRQPSECCIPRILTQHAYQAQTELAYLRIGSTNSGSHGDKSDEIIRNDPSKDKPKIWVDCVGKGGWMFIKKEREEPNVRAKSTL